MSVPFAITTTIEAIKVLAPLLSGGSAHGPGSANQVASMSAAAKRYRARSLAENVAALQTYLRKYNNCQTASDQRSCQSLATLLYSVIQEQMASATGALPAAVSNSLPPTVAPAPAQTAGALSPAVPLVLPSLAPAPAALPAAVLAPLDGTTSAIAPPAAAALQGSAFFPSAASTAAPGTQAASAGLSAQQRLMLLLYLLLRMR